MFKKVKGMELVIKKILKHQDRKTKIKNIRRGCFYRCCKNKNI